MSTAGTPHSMSSQVISTTGRKRGACACGDVGGDGRSCERDRGNTDMRRPVNNALVLGVLLATVGVGQPTFAQMVMAGGPDMTVDAAAKTELIQSLVKGLREAYVFPDVGEKLAHMLLNRQARGEYDLITRAKALNARLPKHLYEIAPAKHLPSNSHSHTIAPIPPH